MRHAAFFDLFRILAPLLLSGGCGLTADFGGLQGGSRDAGLEDAPITDASDSGPDVQFNEAGTGFCASLPTKPHLCADFDEGGPVDQGWSQTDIYDGQSAAIDTVSQSPPASFLSALLATKNGEPASVRLQQFLPNRATTVHIECWMLVPSLNGAYELLALHEQPQSLDGTIGLFLRQESGKLVVVYSGIGPDGGTVSFNRPLGAPLASWMHIEIDVVIGDAGSFVVKVNDDPVIKQDNFPTSTASRQTLFVDVGLYNFQGLAGRANYDNVIVDWTE